MGIGRGYSSADDGSGIYGLYFTLGSDELVRCYGD